MVEQPEVLQHDADALAQIRDLVLAKPRDVLAEQVDQAARRPQRQEQQPQQRGLAGAGGAGEELEGMRRDLETEVAQNLRTKPVAQAYVFEPDQAQLRSMGCAGAAGNPHVRPWTPPTGCAAVMVSDSLTVGS